MNKIFTLLPLFFILFIYKSTNCQCNYQVRASSLGVVPNSIIKVCSGRAVYLSISRNNCPDLSIKENFDNGSINPNIWEPNPNIDYSNSCPLLQLPASGKYAWIGNSSAPRKLTTRALDLSRMEYLEWDMKYGNYLGSGNCNAPTMPGEGVRLQFSLNNGNTWVDFPGSENPPSGVFGSTNYIAGSGYYWTPDSINLLVNPYYKWNRYRTNIPDLIKTPGVKIRFFQSNCSTDSSDYWGIDNFNLVSVPKVTYNWSHGSHLMNPNPVYPTTSTWYHVYIIDSTFIPIKVFRDSVFVMIETNGLTASFTSPDNVCSSKEVDVVYTGNAGVYDTFTWNFGTDSYIISGSGMGPYKIRYDSFFPDSVIYTISLLINENSSCASFASKNISIYGNPTISFMIQPYMPEGCPPLTLDFMNETEPENTSLLWSFGDDSTSTENNPKHTYIKSGNFDVSVFAQTQLGCKDSVTINNFVKVYENDTPNIRLVDNTLYTDIYQGALYEWYKNNEFVYGSTDNFYTPLEHNYYHVVKRNLMHGCVSAPSEKILSFEKTAIYKDDAIFNNLTHDYFSIKYNELVKKIEIYNADGLKVKEFSQKNLLNNYSVEELGNGIYFVRLFIDDVISTKKLIKY